MAQDETRPIAVIWVRARNGDPIPVSYNDGIWYIGSNAQRLCSDCNVVRFDADEFLTCPRCDSVFERGLLEREFWLPYDRMIEASGGRIH
jgi:hypothetical protein